MNKLTAFLAAMLLSSVCLGQVSTENRQTVDRAAGTPGTVVNSFTVGCPASWLCTPSSTSGDVSVTFGWSTPTSGAFLIGNGTDFITSDPGACAGANDALYKPTGTTVGCHSIAGGGGTSIGTDTFWGAKGDIAIATANDAAARHVVPANGSILVADTAQADNWKNLPAATTAEIADISSTATESAGTALGSYALGDHQHALPVAARTVNLELRPEEATFPSTNSAQYEINFGTSFSLSVLSFNTTTEWAAYWKFVATGYVSGNVTARVFWYADTATSGAGPTWGCSIGAITANTDTTDVETKALGSEATVNQAHLGTTGQRLHYVDCVVTSLDSLAADDMVFLKLARKVGDASDTMAGDAHVVMVRLSYLRSF